MVSRGVRCGIVSTPRCCCTSVEVISELIRARAIGLSLMSKNSTEPAAWISAAVPSSRSRLPPLGGSSSTDTTHSPAASRRARRLASAVGSGRRGRRRLAARERVAGGKVLVDRAPDGRDVVGLGAAAAADQPRAQRHRLRGELGGVGLRRVRVEHAAVAVHGQADVGLNGQRRGRRAAHLAQAGQRRLRSQAAVDPDGGRAQIAQHPGGLLAAGAGDRLAVVLDRDLRDHRQVRLGAHRIQRDRQLLQRGERLQHDQVDPAALQHGRLPAVQPGAAGAGAADHLDRRPQRPDRSGDQHVAAGHLTRVAGDLRAGRVDLVDLMLAPVRTQLDGVGAIGIGLDHVGAGPDEAHVRGQHRLRRGQVRLLREAQLGELER